MLLLVCCPILIGFGTIQTRQMRNLHETTANFYSTGASLIIFGVILLFKSNGLTFLNSFSQNDYILLVLSSVMGVFVSLSKTIALQYGMASRVGIVGYLSIVVGLVIDVVFFKTIFSET